MRRLLLWVLWGGALFLLVLAIFLPNTGLAQLRVDIPWFGRTISWIEHRWPSLDMIHILMFFALSLLTRLSWLNLSAAAWLVLMVSVAAASELVQLMVPGRRASWSDFQQDLIGIAAAFFVTILLRSLLTLQRRRGPW